MPSIVTALDMHIEVLQGLQKVDSFQQDMFQPEEIDFQLNKQQDRFVEQLTNQKFQDRQVRLDYIKNLIVKNKTLPVYIPLATDSNYEANMQYGVLPSNYLHMVSDRSEIVTRKSCDDIVYTPESTNQTIQILQFPDPEVDPVTGSYYLGLEITEFNNASNRFYKSRFDVDLQNPTLGSKITEPDYISPLVKDILENINLQTFGSKDQVYWEYYRGEYYPKSFIIVSDQQMVIRTFLNDGNPQGSINSQATPVPVQQVINKDVLKDNKDGLTTIVENKLSEGDELYEFRKNTFYKPTIQEPHSTLSEGFIYLYREAGYILTALTIDYIRKPRQISLLLNQGCELAGSAPRLIVDAAVEYFKLVIENPSYQGILQDNQIRNQNTLTNG